MNAVVPSSGTTGFAPSLGEMVLEAFARVQIRPTSLTADHFSQARMSANLMQAEWSNVGMPLLFKIPDAPLQIPLLPGVSKYQAPADIIAPLDATITLYTPGTGQNFTPVITGAAGSMIATITQPQHGLAAGSLAYWATAVAASGQVIQGPYIVQTVVDPNNYQIALATPLDGSNSVALPVFTATAASKLINVNLPDHGLAIGQSFYCNVPVTVGGNQLSGQLPVVGVVDQNNFTVQIGAGATAGGSATMNGGQAQVATQAPGVDTIDFVLYPISRSDFSGQPDRGPNLQFRPTVFWFQRLINPVISFWNAPDNTGVYVFNLWAMRQPQDAVTPGGIGLDVPYRYFEAYAAGLAAKLARKYPPPPSVGVTVGELRQEAEDALMAALREDIERVPLMISPGLSGYFRA